MKKVLLLLTTVLLLTSCASIKNYSKNPATASFDFKNNETVVLTFWKRLNPDGSVTGPFSVGISKFKLIFNFPFGEAQRTSMQLDPGYYFMDSFQVNFGKNFFVSQKARYTNRNGWDAERNVPKYLAFELKQGQVLNLPSVEILPNFEPDDDIVATFKYNDPENIFIKGNRIIKE